MARDPRAYATITTDYLNNLKMRMIIDESVSAVTLHIAAITSSAGSLTDGAFDVRMTAFAACANVCDWHASRASDHDDSECDPMHDGVCDVDVLLRHGAITRRGGVVYQVHDYLEHNRSAAEAKERETAGRKGGRARAANAASSAANTASSSAANTASSKRDREIERKNKLPAAAGLAGEVPGAYGETPQTGSQARPETASKNQRHTYQEEFEAFYALYPRKKDKRTAQTAWNTAVKRASVDEIMAGLKTQLPELKSKEPGYVKHPTTWLRGNCWANEPDDAPKTDLSLSSMAPGLSDEERDARADRTLARQRAQAEAEASSTPVGPRLSPEEARKAIRAALEAEGIDPTVLDRKPVTADR